LNKLKYPKIMPTTSRKMPVATDRTSAQWSAIFSTVVKKGIAENVAVLL